MMLNAVQAQLVDHGRGQLRESDGDCVVVADVEKPSGSHPHHQSGAGRLAVSEELNNAGLWISVGRVEFGLIRVQTRAIGVESLHPLQQCSKVGQQFLAKTR